jgi:hypothetical protein
MNIPRKSDEEGYQIHEKIRPPDEKIIRSRPWKRVMIAAAILLLVGAGPYVWYLSTSGSVPFSTGSTAAAGEIKAPSSNKAILILASGEKVNLGNAAKGQVAKEGNSTIMKVGDGQLMYEGAMGRVGNDQLAYNTIFNPRGSKVMDVTLSDGSRVWLNAGSSLTYPAVFGDLERKVAVDGEAYFEIAYDKNRPFRVTKNEMLVVVLGTHFIVNAYDDEDQIAVTLLEGAVKVNKGMTFASLAPGQQAVVATGITVNSHVDVDAAIAWKDGLFSFQDSDLQGVLRQISRWYDVKVVYEGNTPSRKFEGEFQRDLNLSQVLKILERNNIRYKLEGKAIVITN